MPESAHNITSLHDAVQQAHDQAVEKQKNDLRQWKARLSNACSRDCPEPSVDHATYATERSRRIWENERTLEQRAAEIKEIFARVDIQMRIKKHKFEPPKPRSICWERLNETHSNAANTRATVDGLVWKKRKPLPAASGNKNVDGNILLRAG